MHFVYHVDQLDASQERLCPTKRFESQHQFYPAFNATMILLNNVIQVFTLPDGDGFFIRFSGIEYGQCRGVGATFSDGNDFRFNVIANGVAEEAQGCCGIPLRRLQKVDCPAFGIDRTVKIFPLPTDFYVGFIHSPPVSHGTFMLAERLIQHWYQTDDPAVKRVMVDGDTPLRHHLLQITQAQGISQVPADALSNNIGGIMQAFKGFLDQLHSQSTSCKNSMLPDYPLNATERRNFDDYLIPSGDFDKSLRDNQLPLAIPTDCHEYIKSRAKRLEEVNAIALAGDLPGRIKASKLLRWIRMSLQQHPLLVIWFMACCLILNLLKCWMKWMAGLVLPYISHTSKIITSDLKTESCH